MTLSALGLLPVPTAAARPGALDMGFGAHGRVFSHPTYTLADSGFKAIVAQPDGKLLVEGVRENGSVYGSEGVIERRDANGSLDGDFGKQGEVVLPDAAGLALQGDGRILFGESNPIEKCQGVRRLDADGSLDGSFGSKGCSAKLPFGIEQIAVDGEGRIVVAGNASHGPYVHDLPPPQELVLARLLPDGSLDAGFGNSGFVHTYGELGLATTEARGLALDSDGGVVVAGDELLLRFTANGALDKGFGTGGEVKTAGEARAVLVQPGGEIVLASAAGGATVTRYLPNGVSDPSFGKEGATTLPAGSVAETAAIASTEKGDLLLAGDSSRPGSCFECSEYSPVMVQLEANGSLDPAYGQGGIADLGARPSLDERRSGSVAGLAVTARDGAVVAGGPRYGSGDAYLIGRNADGSADAGFGQGGSVVDPEKLLANTEAAGLATRPNGDLVVSAETNARSHEIHPVLIHFKADGRPDRAGSGSAISPSPSNAPIGAAGSHALFSILEGAGKRVLRFDGSGQLDRAYGSRGAARLPRGFRVGSFLVQPDGFVTVVGGIARKHDMAVYRLDPRGHPVRRFGHGGLALIPFGGSFTAALSLSIEPDGRIVVVGWARAHAAAARLLPDGRLDPSFGDQGRVVRLLGPHTAASIVVRQGRDLLVACEPESVGPDATILVRLDHAGRRMRSFGSGGVLRPGGKVEPFALFATKRGSLLITRRGFDSSGGVRLRAYLRDGRVDRAFGHLGTTIAAADQRRFYFNPVSATRQPNGKIVVAGTAEAGLTGYRVELLRFDMR
jgi:uncharacterized delta-60 repeat protein